MKTVEEIRAHFVQVLARYGNFDPYKQGEIDTLKWVLECK